MNLKHQNWISKIGFKLMRLLLAVLLVTMIFGTTTQSAAETKDGTSDRKVVTRVEPEYPETLKRLYIGGVVRVQVTVQPSGDVETTELVGGSPILGQSAMKAIKQWKYAKAGAPETFVVRLEFDPHR